ncbi:MAG: NADH-quinone oxidoreductase subunit C [Cyclobacteriaceae bacterium]
MAIFEELFLVVGGSCAHGGAVADETMIPKGVKIQPADLKSVCMSLHQNPSVFFDMLSCITVVDNGPETGTMEIVYNLYSIPFDHHLALKVIVPRDSAELDSVESIWKTANWHEREAFDMFGIKFKGHPDLRRILMPGDWDGHPLRKDYKQQEYYRGVKLDY